MIRPEKFCNQRVGEKQGNRNKNTANKILQPSHTRNISSLPLTGIFIKVHESSSKKTSDHHLCKKTRRGHSRLAGEINILQLHRRTHYGTHVVLIFFSLQSRGSATPLTMGGKDPFPRPFRRIQPAIFFSTAGNKRGFRYDVV